MARKNGVPNKTQESVSLSWGAVPHEQFPQERIREQRILEGSLYLNREVAQMEMSCAQEENTIGINLAAARERAGYTQSQVATALGVSARTVRKYERGEGVPDALQLRLLAIIYGVSVDWLLGLIGDEASRLLELYDFSTPRQRRGVVAMARTIQGGESNQPEQWASADKQEWAEGAEERQKRLVKDLERRWGREEARAWVEDSEGRDERLGRHLSEG